MTLTASEMATEIKRLAQKYADADRYEKSCKAENILHAAIDRLASLASQSEEQGKDAGRLDWMDKAAVVVWNRDSFAIHLPKGSDLDADTIREIIDAAMATPKEGA